jgi:excisionase family DNA binding protein
MLPDFVGAQEAARQLGVTASRLYHMAHTGKIRGRRQGKPRRLEFHRNEVERAKQARQEWYLNRAGIGPTRT